MLHVAYAANFSLLEYCLALNNTSKLITRQLTPCGRSQIKIATHNFTDADIWRFLIANGLLCHGTEDRRKRLESLANNALEVDVPHIEVLEVLFQHGQALFDAILSVAATEADPSSSLDRRTIMASLAQQCRAMWLRSWSIAAWISTTTGEKLRMTPGRCSIHSKEAFRVVELRVCFFYFEYHTEHMLRANHSEEINSQAPLTVDCRKRSISRPSSAVYRLLSVLVCRSRD